MYLFIPGHYILRSSLCQPGGVHFSVGAQIQMAGAAEGAAVPSACKEATVASVEEEGLGRPRGAGGRRGLPWGRSSRVGDRGLKVQTHLNTALLMLVQDEKKAEDLPFYLYQVRHIKCHVWGSS